MDLAANSGAPVVGLIDSGGARIQEGIDSLAGYSAIFQRNNNMEEPPQQRTQDDPERRDRGLLHVVPDNPNQPYDMMDIILQVVDDGDFMEVHELYARNIIVGFARFDGRPVGIVAQQPDHLAGLLDINASTKAARFIRFCDAFNVPLVTFIDVPGYMPGTVQEHGGIIKHGAKLLYAYAEATVPKTASLVRKAYGARTSP
ncbi:Propionyl-CoA carboxylase beta chain [Geodia barretti]|uniref:Propionyl-CoA carboxylase beta chain n=1 Tax=Geodia barretti TaxID=519541 RepID=A0AA35SGP2_GEOBA|nr:Propionyl-CoA carboxylase beta chain [Geodia barretti]